MSRSAIAVLLFAVLTSAAFAEQLPLGGLRFRSPANNLVDVPSKSAAKAWVAGNSALAVPKAEPIYGNYNTVFNSLAQSLVDWVPARYMMPAPDSQYELPERMVADAMVVAPVSKWFVFYLSSVVKLCSACRYEILMPNGDRLGPVGGYPFPMRLVRHDNKTGEDRDFVLRSDGSTSLSER